MNTVRNNNTIEVGKNKYVVTTTLNTLIFKQIEHIDTNTNNNHKQYKIINQFSLLLNTIEEINEFKKLLNNTYEQKVITYKNITLDFSNYDRKSVDIIIDQVNWIEKFIPKSYLV